jgi:hypothetical protein
MKRTTLLMLLVAAFLGLMFSTCFAAGGGVQLQEYAITADPCLNHNTVKVSATISITTATTTNLVATSGTKKVYVCDVAVTMSGTNPTATFITGTTTTNPCDTGASNLTGAMSPSATVGNMKLGYGGTVMKTAAGGALCVTTGATTAVYGLITYVAQ